MRNEGMMRMIRWLALGLWMTAPVSWSQEAQFTEPGWFNAAGAPQEVDLGGEPGVSAAGGAEQESIAEASTPEIEALARGLEKDPLRIFNYVHDHIRHVFYFGSKKGAQLTLLERSGNDFDQCALLVALLRAGRDTRTPVTSLAFWRCPMRVPIITTFATGCNSVCPTPTGRPQWIICSG